MTVNAQMLSKRTCYSGVTNFMKLKDFEDIATPLIDITGSGTEDVQVEITKRPDGQPIIYIHAFGRTIVRLCQPKSVEIL